MAGWFALGERERELRMTFSEFSSSLLKGAESLFAGFLKATIHSPWETKESEKVGGGYLL